MGDQIIMLARISQEIPAVCDPKLKIEGTQLLAIQQVQSTTVEAILEVKASLHRDLEPIF